MKIINCGSGIHSREVKGVEKLQSLPANWVAYTNVDLISGPHKTCEIDVILITPDRIMLIDLKDWRGAITSQNGRWEQNGRDVCKSPVYKMLQNVRDTIPSFSAHFKKHSKGRSKCELEREKGYDAKAYIVALTKSGKVKIVRDYGYDRYQRLVVDLSVDGVDVGERAIADGILKAWPHRSGRALSAKPDWCQND